MPCGKVAGLVAVSVWIAEVTGVCGQIGQVSVPASLCRVCTYMYIDVFCSLLDILLQNCFIGFFLLTWVVWYRCTTTYCACIAA